MKFLNRKIRAPRDGQGEKMPAARWRDFGLEILSNQAGVSIPLALLFVLSILASSGVAAEADVTPFHIGFSKRLFTEVNINDARASVKTWAQTVAQERKIPADPEPAIFDGVAPMAGAMAESKLDALALTVDEYWLLSQKFHFDPVFVALQNGRTNVEYLVLVHQDSGIQSFKDLRGRSLACYDNPQTTLALPWLDNQLMELGFGLASNFFSRISQAKKASATVLPVFFQKTEACLVDRGSFEVMSELNPQLGRQLKVLASSPPLVPMLFCLRSDYAPAFKSRLETALLNLHETVAGQQVLTVFQMDRLLASPVSCLDSAVKLLAAHQRLCSGTNSAASSGPSLGQTRSDTAERTSK